MVDVHVAPTPGATPPSMGPPSIPYVPPITLEEAVVRARVRIRRRNRRGGRALIVAIVLLSLPFLQALSALFPSDPLAKVPFVAYAYFLGVAAAFLFLGWATYRVLTDRPAVSYAVLGVGGALAFYYGYTVWTIAQLLLHPDPTSLVDPSVVAYTIIMPVLGLATGSVAVLAGILALPRAVAVAAPA